MQNVDSFSKDSFLEFMRQNSLEYFVGGCREAYALINDKDWLASKMRDIGKYADQQAIISAEFFRPLVKLLELGFSTKELDEIEDHSLKSKLFKFTKLADTKEDLIKLTETFIKVDESLLEILISKYGKELVKYTDMLSKGYGRLLLKSDRLVLPWFIELNIDYEKFDEQYDRFSDYKIIKFINTINELERKQKSIEYIAGFTDEFYRYFTVGLNCLSSINTYMTDSVAYCCIVGELYMRASKAKVFINIDRYSIVKSSEIEWVHIINSMDGDWIIPLEDYLTYPEDYSSIFPDFVGVDPVLSMGHHDLGNKIIIRYKTSPSAVTTRKITDVLPSYSIANSVLASKQTMVKDKRRVYAFSRVYPLLHMYYCRHQKDWDIIIDRISDSVINLIFGLHTVQTSMLNVCYNIISLKLKPLPVIPNNLYKGTTIKYKDKVIDCGLVFSNLTLLKQQLAEIEEVRGYRQIVSTEDGSISIELY